MTAGTLPDPTRALRDVPHHAAAHLSLLLLAAVLRLAGLALRAAGSPEAVLDRFPFLAGYLDQVAARGLEGASIDTAQRWWDAAIAGFEATAPATLPLPRLRHATGLDAEALVLLAACGLPDEDARFGGMLETLQGAPGLRRVTPALAPDLLGAAGSAGPTLRRLRQLGLLDWSEDGGPRAERALVPPAAVWDALRGEAPEGDGLRFTPLAAAPSLASLVLGQATRERLLEALPLLGAGEAAALLVRGVPANGRRSVLAAIARELGLGVLDLPPPTAGGEAAWRQAGAIATLLGAMPRLAAELAPGAVLALPAAPGLAHPIGVALGTQGSVVLGGTGQALTLALPLPDAAERAALWSRGLGSLTPAGPRMASGRILRAAALARALGRAGSGTASAALPEAMRSLDRQALDGLARHLPPPAGRPGLAGLAVPPATAADLAALLLRCRHAEALAALPGGAAAAGVRALFRGPSGTGKTLAARLVAAELGLDLYRADLASLVDKYIGETEKNLERLFAAAESLGVALLLDEGDALMAGRTSVGSAQDRWANLETSFLLQRLEAYEGVVMVTTNAAERIDTAFQRRMDAIIDFPMPEAAERARILALHLPATHTVPPIVLERLAARCALAGGALRNAVLHAALLAIEAERPLGAAELEAAMVREYRKQGAIAPLRRGIGG